MKRAQRTARGSKEQSADLIVYRKEKDVEDEDEERRKEITKTTFVKLDAKFGLDVRLCWERILVELGIDYVLEERRAA